MSDSTSLVPSRPGALAHTGGALAAYSPDQVALLKRTIARETSDDELQLFVATARRLQLDPFAKQIYAVMRWDSRAGHKVMVIQISIDGQRSLADRTGNYVPGPAPTFACNAAGDVVSATAYVKKWSHGEWHTVEGSAWFDEFCETTKDGQLTQMWREKPRVMIGKCAEAQALRRAFPAEMAGAYNDAEVGDGDAVDAEVHAPVHAPPPPPPRPRPPAPSTVRTETVLAPAAAPANAPPSPTPTERRPPATPADAAAAAQSGALANAGRPAMRTEAQQLADQGVDLDAPASDAAEVGDGDAVLLRCLAQSVTAADLEALGKPPAHLAPAYLSRGTAVYVVEQIAKMATLADAPALAATIKAALAQGQMSKLDYAWVYGMYLARKAELGAGAR